MEKTKNQRHADHLDEDFEVIELGSVSEETKGIAPGTFENGGSLVSRD